MSIRSPALAEVLSLALDERASLVRVCIPGVVERFNRTTQTAEVRPAVLKADGSELPVIPYAPVVFPGVYWDVQPGESGLLLVADDDWRTWWRTGEIAEPEAVASHELSNALFLPGLVDYAHSRSLPVGDVVLPRATVGGEVLIGDDTATKAAVHEDLLSALNTFMADLSTWVTAVDAAAGPFPSTALLQAEIAAVIAGIAAGSYQSPSVKVED